jgi:hypothetical protein
VLAREQRQVVEIRERRRHRRRVLDGQAGEGYAGDRGVGSCAGVSGHPQGDDGPEGVADEEDGARRREPVVQPVLQLAEQPGLVGDVLLVARESAGGAVTGPVQGQDGEAELRPQAQQRGPAVDGTIPVGRGVAALMERDDRRPGSARLGLGVQAGDRRAGDLQRDLLGHARSPPPSG